jgi:hypothetical protein
MRYISDEFPNSFPYFSDDKLTIPGGYALGNSIRDSARMLRETRYRIVRLNMFVLL